MGIINNIIVNSSCEMISSKEYLEALCHPFEDNFIDTCLAIILFFISTGALALSVHLSIKPYPPSLGYKLSRYLMETDSTACYGQNTQHNRDNKR